MPHGNSGFPNSTRIWQRPIPRCLPKNPAGLHKPPITTGSMQIAICVRTTIGGNLLVFSGVSPMAFLGPADTPTVMIQVGDPEDTLFINYIPSISTNVSLIRGTIVWKSVLRNYPGKLFRAQKDGDLNTRVQKLQEGPGDEFFNVEITI